MAVKKRSLNEIDFDRLGEFESETLEINSIHGGHTTHTRRFCRYLCVNNVSKLVNIEVKWDVKDQWVLNVVVSQSEFEFPFRSLTGLTVLDMPEHADELGLGAFYRDYLASWAEAGGPPGYGTLTPLWAWSWYMGGKGDKQG